MSHFIHILVILFLSISFSLEAQAQKKDCSCLQVSCGPCQKKVTVGKIVKFCDWGDINVCRKTICENVNYYFNCLSKHTKGRTNEDNGPKSDINFVYEEDSGDKKKRKSKKNRSPSSVVTKKKSQGDSQEAQGRIEVGNDSRVDEGVTYSEVVIGTSTNSNKNIKVFHRGKVKSWQKKTKLFIGDEISNKSNKTQKATIRFDNGTASFHLKPKTKIVVEDPNSIVGRFQPFLYLVHGGMNYNVDMKEGFFDLLSGQILTRSQGGHHFVGYEMGQEGLKVKVENFSGPLQIIKAQDLSGKSISLKPGNFVSWMSETPGHLFNSDEKQALAGEGFITPVFEMTDARKKKLGLIKPPAPALFADWAKVGTKKSGRDLASLDGLEGLCQAPQAKYQQCAWSCEGNKKGSGSCEAEKSNVHCVRRVCNAAGQWGAPTAFASSYKDLCPAKGVRVGECSP